MLRFPFQGILDGHIYFANQKTYSALLQMLAILTWHKRGPSHHLRIQKRVVHIETELPLLEGAEVDS